ncbi:hypothetical protein Tco_0021261, partial [Tanacetum coccineum]
MSKKALVAPSKKSSITTDDNILPDPDEDLKLGKSINRTEVEIAEEKRQVHETHDKPQKLKGIQGSNEEVETISSSDDEEHGDEEVHEEKGHDDEEFHADEEAHNDKYVHDDDEKHDADERADEEKANEEMNDAENVDEVKDDQ